MKGIAQVMNFRHPSFVFSIFLMLFALVSGMFLKGKEGYRFDMNVTVRGAMTVDGKLRVGGMENIEEMMKFLQNKLLIQNDTIATQERDLLKYRALVNDLERELALQNETVNSVVRSLDCEKEKLKSLSKFATLRHGYSFFQNVSTIGAAGVASFTIDGETYLAFANYWDGAHSNLDSPILKWNGKKLVEYQLIPTRGVMDFHPFEIDGEMYIGAVMWNDDVEGHLTNSTVLKWNTELKLFEEYQRILTHGGRNMDFFEMQGNRFLCFANENGDSELLKWDGTKFQHFQFFGIANAFDVESFVTEDAIFLTFTVYRTCNDSSLIYRWNGSMFEQFQIIPSSYAIGLESFEVDGRYFLAVANTIDCVSDTSTHVNSEIFVWNGLEFEHFQYLPTKGGRDFLFFQVNGNAFLVVANRYDSQTASWLTQSVIYSWNGKSFVVFQEVDTWGVVDWTDFEIDGVHYLAASTENYSPSGSAAGYSTIFSNAATLS